MSTMVFDEREDVPFEELPITNNFMFCKVFSDKDICKEFLETMLHVKIRRIEKCMSEMTAQTDVTAKGVRYDVYLEDSENSFDIEMQIAKNPDIPLRARFYQAVCDIDSLKPKDTYSVLKQNYIIFICPFDLFKKGLPVYTFENTCKEDPTLKLGDKTEKIFYYFKEYDKMKDNKARAVLEYFDSGKSTDAFTKRIQNALDRVRNNPDYRRQFMNFEQIMNVEREIARKEGMEIGLAEGREAGLAEGRTVGLAEGREAGLAEGREAGLAEGRTVGLAEGRTAGIAEGVQQGVQQKSLEIAKKMLVAKKPIDEIILFTDLTEKQIREIEI